MKEFQDRGTHTRVLLMNRLQSRREKLFRANTVFYTPFPKDRNCELCQRTKITRANCRRRTGEVVHRAENVGDLVTADHKVLSEGCESRNNHRHAVVVQDLATQWIQSYPCKTKTSQGTERSLQKFLEPTRKPKVIYTDNSLWFGKACEDLSWNYCASTPHRSETNEIVERAARRIKEMTSAVLLQSGLGEEWWADFMVRYCYTRHVQDLVCDGKTPFERRIGEPSKGPVIPLRSKFEYHPISAKDQSRIHQFGKEVLPGTGPVLEVKNVCPLDVEIVIPSHLGMLPILGLYDPEAATWTSYDTMIQIIHQNALKKRIMKVLRKLMQNSRLLNREPSAVNPKTTFLLTKREWIDRTANEYSLKYQ